ncbi:MAG: hypothetical protein IKL32_04085 [Alphaproteobacteria bacterium]|nr:hypothetical protein [Alphaproteobacteria bacterium]
MAMNIKQEEINILDSRVFANATHKNDSRMSESGRSMVEMLGTLAIIGVLSIGGIAGYSYGMDKYRANTTINDINLRSIDLLTQKENGQELNLDQWGTHSTVGYEWGDYGYVAGHDAVDMSLLGVPKYVCEMIIEGADTSITQISINSVAVGDSTACNDDNDMTFYYGIPETCGDTECDFETSCLYSSESNKEECLKYGIRKCAEIDGEEWCSIWAWMFNMQHTPNWYQANKICGLLGKRLPTTDELWDSTANGPSNLMNELKNKGFINASNPRGVWTATQVNSTTAYMVDITSGLSKEAKTRRHNHHAYIAVCRGN